MTETSSTEVPTASLVGALSVFPLNDVLGLLSETTQRGELQVVGQGVDGHLWIDGKSLVGSVLEGTGTITQAVFELMLLEEGWFYFTSDQAPPISSNKQQSVSSVISEVVPQVQEWRDLLSRVPLTAEVRMAASTPSAEVQIRADQWKILTAVGTTGRTVASIVDELDEDSVVTVRLLRELVDSGLVAITDTDSAPVPTSTSYAPEPVVTDSDPVVLNSTKDNSEAGDAVPPPPPGFVTSPQSSVADTAASSGGFETRADGVPTVAPPSAADPWAPPGRGMASNSSPGHF
jgi:hypothetical protein